MNTRAVKMIGVAALVALTAVGAMAAAKKTSKPRSGNAPEVQAPPRPAEMKPQETSDQNAVRLSERHPEAAAMPKESPSSQPAPLGGDSAVVATSDSASYVLDAAVLSTGAAIGDSSSSYRLDWTAGELAVSESESPSYKMSLGFLRSCNCPFQGDMEPDGFITALDLAACIDVLFAGALDVQDADCPSPRFDLDCDWFSTALDLAVIIDHLFAGGNGPCDPCTP